MPRFFVQKFCAAGVKRGGRIRGKRSARRSAKMPFVCKIGAFRARILHFVQQNQQNMPKLFPNRGGYGIINAVQVRTLSGGRAGLSCAPSEKRGPFFVFGEMPYPPAVFFPARRPVCDAICAKNLSVCVKAIAFFFIWLYNVIKSGSETGDGNLFGGRNETR